MLQNSLRGASPCKKPPRPDFREECLAGAEIRAASGDGGHGVITALHPQRGSVSRVPKNGVSSVCRGFQFSAQRASAPSQHLLQHLLNGRSERPPFAKCRCMYLR